MRRQDAARRGLVQFPSPLRSFRSLSSLECRDNNSKNRVCTPHTVRSTVLRAFTSLVRSIRSRASQDRGVLAHLTPRSVVRALPRAIAARTRASWCVIRTRSISFTRVMSPRALVSYSRDVRSTAGRARNAPTSAVVPRANERPTTRERAGGLHNVLWVI